MDLKMNAIKLHNYRINLKKTKIKSFNNTQNTKFQQRTIKNPNFNNTQNKAINYIKKIVKSMEKKTLDGQELIMAILTPFSHAIRSKYKEFKKEG